MKKAQVYFTKKIDSESLISIYRALETELNGNVGVKISTGEPGGHYFLQPSLIKGLTNLLNGTIIECCTAYGGKRMNPNDHWTAIKDHGFLDIAPCDIMDEFGEMNIPIKNGYHLEDDIVGEHLSKYNSLLILSHFKGHIMGGFGGALKNMSIGIASSHGKALIHSAGYTKDCDETWEHDTIQDEFLESMADACKGVVDYIGEKNIAYINVANNLSIDCDCDSNPHKPEMDNIGIFASLNPVALDQSCYDAVVNSDDPGKASLIERMNSRHAIHVVEAAENLGLGTHKYDLVCID